MGRLVVWVERDIVEQMMEDTGCLVMNATKVFAYYIG
jgi:hypothetical protein